MEASRPAAARAAAYRETARQLYALAAEVTNTEAASLLLRVAKDYERLALYAESTLGNIAAAGLSDDGENAN